MKSRVENFYAFQNRYWFASRTLHEQPQFWACVLATLRINGYVFGECNEVRGIFGIAAHLLSQVKVPAHFHQKSALVEILQIGEQHLSRE